MPKSSLRRGEEGTRGVDEYIATCPKDVRGRLQQIRAAIREVAPDAGETTRYFDLPGYFLPGYDYHGMFVWFSFKDSAIRLHLRPPTIQEHAPELAAYATTKAIVRFRTDQEIPIPLVQKLVKASLKVMRARA